MEALAAIAAVALLASGRKKTAAPKPPEEKPKESPKGVDVGGVVGTVGTVATIVGGVGKLVGSVGSLVGQAAGAVGSTILGVSTGFVVVGGLWAVSLIVGIVVGKVLAPEMDRRKTLPAWLTSEPWGIAWRASREFWLEGILTKTTGFVRRSCRWVAGDGRYGDLNVQGELTFLVGGETEPPADRFAFYDWLAWARERVWYRRVPALVEAENGAHYLARIFGRSFLATSRAIATATGQVGAFTTEPLAELAAEGFTPLGAGAVAASSTGAPGVNVKDVIAAVSAGCAAGRGVSNISYGPGGEWLLKDVSKAQLALAVCAGLRANGFAWVGVDGGAVTFGSDGQVDMPGGVE